MSRLPNSAVLAGMLLILTAAPVRSAGPAETNPRLAPEALRAATDRGRALLEVGQIQSAEQLIAGALALGEDDSLLCLWGEIQFRRANFDEAAQAFRTATTLNPSLARAWWGLGRIEEISFRRQTARDLFARAYQLDPVDCDIILSYAGYVPRLLDRAVLFRNVVALSWQTNRERARRAVAQLEIDRRLGGKIPARLVSPYTSYRLPLTGFHPAGTTQDGLLVAVRINGGKTLKLVLDTGARGILVYARTAGALGLEPIVESRLGGFGEAGTSGVEAQLTLAHKLTAGDLEFEDCLVQVSRREITPGADGILGAGLFERFRMRVDARSRTLDLVPLDETRPATKESIAAIGLRDLLLVKTAVAGKQGWFLLDTGAAYTTLARDMAPLIMRKGVAADLVGVGGGVAAPYLLGPLSLAVGGRPLVDIAPVAFDLAPLSQIEGVEISGLLGYPALSRTPFSFDLRSGEIRFEDR